MKITKAQKIVNCTPEQYMELLKSGQVEINGEIKTKEEGTLYNTGNLELLEWYNKIMEAEYKEYEGVHTPVAMKALETEYQELITPIYDNEAVIESAKASKHSSAIGYTAILKSGDTIKVTAPNNGEFYINGERVTNDYTYTGNGYEVVNVWVFEGLNGNMILPPQLVDTPTFNIIELDVKNIAQTPVVGDGYKNYALTLRAYNFLISGATTRKLISNGTETFNQKTIGTYIEEVESDCATYNITGNFGLTSKTTLKKVVFPNLENIKGTGAQTFLGNCTNADLVIIFPKLKVINDVAYDGHAPFLNVVSVTLPPSVNYVGKNAFNATKTIVLNCNKAAFHNEWCKTAPSVNFDMCENWQGSINIAIAAKNHTKDWFISLFRNKLQDFSTAGETDVIYINEITIPLAILNALTDEEIAIAEDKGWIVGGA